MRVDTVEQLKVFVLEDDDAKIEKVDYKYWVSIGDFFHLLLSESTPTITYKDIQDDIISNDGDISASTKLIPLLVGLKIMKEINQMNSNERAGKIIAMFEEYVQSHIEDIEVDYDTEEDEVTKRQKTGD
jgi:hypothetical protein